jgi:tetratricopeptide (TPR) repeat protein
MVEGHRFGADWLGRHGVRILGKLNCLELRARSRRLQSSAVYSPGLGLVSRAIFIRTMSRTRLFVLQVLGLLTLAAALAAAPAAARADDYGDVNGLRRSGQLAEALARADQYLATRPRDPQMRFLKGVIQTEAGRTADAIGTFVALNQDYPELPEPYNNLAVLYAGQSEFDKARVALEMAVRANPGYAVAHENLGDVYAKLAGISYAKARQLDANGVSVQPKLALIQQLLTPAGKAAPQNGAPVPPAGAKPASGS